MLEEVRHLFALYDAARTMAMKRFKVEIPGFDLTLLKGAAANPAPRRDDAPAAPNSGTNAAAPAPNPPASDRWRAIRSTRLAVLCVQAELCAT